MKIKVLILLLTISGNVFSQTNPKPINWPDGKEVAISLTFDDGRESQVINGTPLLDEYGAKATFYVVPSAVSRQIDKWKAAVKNGHEIGNHSLVHPCSGNFLWARKNALEEYSLDKMKTELQDANSQIKKLLGVEAKQFAYPCGQTFVGRGKDTKSYVPVIAELFNSGRVWLSEAPNDPTYCDQWQLTGMESDGKDFVNLLSVIEQARGQRLWIVFAGHDIADSGAQTTRLNTLKALLEYAKDPNNKIWIAPVGVVQSYVDKQRSR